MIPSFPASDKSQRQLLKLFSRLDKENQQHVLAYLEFLVARSQSPDKKAEEEIVNEEPVNLPRPENESVVAAIRRLSKSYRMLDKSDMLHETSDLMSSHVLKGRPAEEVIDELEVLFLRHYEKKKQADSGE